MIETLKTALSFCSTATQLRCRHPAFPGIRIESSFCTSKETYEPSHSRLDTSSWGRGWDQIAAFSYADNAHHQLLIASFWSRQSLVLVRSVRHLASTPRQIGGNAINEWPMALRALSALKDVRPLPSPASLFLGERWRESYTRRYTDTDGCIYRDSCCDMQPWVRAVHLYCSA